MGFIKVFMLSALIFMQISYVCADSSIDFSIIGPTKETPNVVSIKIHTPFGDLSDLIVDIKDLDNIELIEELVLEKLNNYNWRK